MPESFTDGLRVVGDMPASGIKLIVIILSFNQGEFLSSAINSVLSQDYAENYLTIVHDDASTDESKDLIESLVISNPGRIVGLLQSKNKFSIGVNILQGIQDMFDSIYVARLDADDFWLSKDKLRRQIDFMDNNLEVAISGHSVLILDENTGELSIDLLRNYGFLNPRRLAFSNFLATASVVYRVEFFSPLPNDFTHYYIQDWPLWSILSSRGSIYFHHDLISMYRIHKNNGFARKSNAVFINDTLAINRMIWKYLNSKPINIWTLTFFLRSIAAILDRVSFFKSSTVLNKVFNFLAGISRLPARIDSKSELLELICKRKFQTDVRISYKNASFWK